MRCNERCHRRDSVYRAGADRLLASADLTEMDRAAVRAFIDEVQATSHISPSRRYKLMQMLLGLRRFCPKPFSEMLTADAFLAVGRIPGRQFAQGHPALAELAA